MKGFIAILAVITLAGCASIPEPTTIGGYECVRDCRAESRACTAQAQGESSAYGVGNAWGCGAALSYCRRQCADMEARGLFD